MNRRDFQRKRGRVRCRACLTKKAAHSHHVTYEQELRKRGLPLYDRLNLMELCMDCHFSHHNRSKVIPLMMLSDDHLDYAFAKLGAYAYDYLTRRYAGEDDRLESRLEEAA